MNTKLFDIARAAGHDAGNRSMKAAGRTSWSVDDFNAAAAEMNRILGDENEDPEDP
jgi:hypothetical protein